MAKAKVLNGKDFMVFMGSKATALATSHKLSLSADTSNAASKDDGLWDEAVITKMKWNVTTDALVAASDVTTDESYDAMFDKMIAGLPVEVVCGIPTNSANDGVPEGGWTAPVQKCYKGKALITSLERTDGVGNNSTMSIQLQGVGKLEKVAGA